MKDAPRARPSDSPDGKTRAESRGGMVSPRGSHRALGLFLTLACLIPICSCANPNGIEVPATPSTAIAGAVVTLTSLSSGPPATEEAVPITGFDSPFGPMSLYEGRYPFTMQYPADWPDAAGKDDRCGLHHDVSFVSERGQVLVIEERDLGDVGGKGMSLEEYLDIVLPDYNLDAPGYELLSREQIETTQGHVGEVITYTLYDGAVKARMLWFAYDGKAITATYLDYESEFDKLEPLIDYSFRSLQAIEGE